MDDLKTELFWYMKAVDDEMDEASDGAWFCALEGCVQYWNETRGTKFDENDLAHEYLTWKNSPEGP